MHKQVDPISVSLPNRRYARCCMTLSKSKFELEKLFHVNGQYSIKISQQIMIRKTNTYAREKHSEVVAPSSFSYARKATHCGTSPNRFERLK